MTVRFRCTTTIAAPVDTVFDLSLNIDAHAAGMARYQERAVAGVTGGQIGLGEHVTWRARHLRVTWTMTSRIVALARPWFFVDQQVRGPFARYRHEHRFASVGDGTEMVDEVSFVAPYWPPGTLASPLLRFYLKHLIVRRNRYLKEQAEGAGPVIRGGEGI